MAPFRGKRDEMNDDQKAMYQAERQRARKELWKAGVEASAQGNTFLMDMLEVLQEEEAEKEAEQLKVAQLQRLIRKTGGSNMIPYRKSGYSDLCRSFIEDPLYKVCSVTFILLAGMIGALDSEMEEGSSVLWVVILDWFLIVWFCIECAIQIHAEGAHPQCYFFGRFTDSWSTQARWNVFDFTVGAHPPSFCCS